MPRKLSVAELQTIISPHIDRFRRALWPVWDEYMRIPDEIRLTFDLTTEANALHSISVGKAKREFSDVPGVQLVDGSSYYIGIDGLAHGIEGQAACRIKKLDINGHSQNYPTEHAVALRKNRVSALELEISDATVVDVGYVLDPLGRGFARIQAVRVLGEQFILEIPREEGGTVRMPLPLPLPGKDAPKKRFGIASRKDKSGTEPKN